MYILKVYIQGKNAHEAGCISQGINLCIKHEVSYIGEMVFKYYKCAEDQSL